MDFLIFQDGPKFDEDMTFGDWEKCELTHTVTQDEKKNIYR